MVQVEQLVKIYGDQRAVNGISFTASKGTITGFLGPNGAGKSTTMKIATAFIPPSAGTVLVGGYDVVSHPLEVKRKVGYLPEHNPLYLDMYVHEYLQFSGSLHGLRGNRLSTRISEVIGMVGLGLEQRKKIGALSKGYRQRVGLAQAILHDPEVLILDEPTTGLDPVQILEIRDVIKEMGKEKTVIFSTHIMQEVQALCQRVVIINRGTIVADDQVESLKKLNSEHRTLRAEFASEIEISTLQSLPFVISVTALGNGKYEIQTEKDIRGDLFNWASAQGISLLELNQVERSLESVFKDLTTQK
ncbi:MAG: gliding motility-associated ABC transporter ATP-binding subunit GldA [Cytophagaceae bacterium]|jgi:ABC-2 type transport system ATP-binding protein|nr:gliding motility-associated ABC transporter ATP-binding subunit GldA [Cytophagaceae bacterium]